MMTRCVKQLWGSPRHKTMCNIVWTSFITFLSKWVVCLTLKLLYIQKVQHLSLEIDHVHIYMRKHKYSNKYLMKILWFDLLLVKGIWICSFRSCKSFSTMFSSIWHFQKLFFVNWNDSGYHPYILTCQETNIFEKRT